MGGPPTKESGGNFPEAVCQATIRGSFPLSPTLASGIFSERREFTDAEIKTIVDTLPTQPLTLEHGKLGAIGRITSAQVVEEGGQKRIRFEAQTFSPAALTPEVQRHMREYLRALARFTPEKPTCGISGGVISYAGGTSRDNPHMVCGLDVALTMTPADDAARIESVEGVYTSRLSKEAQSKREPIAIEAVSVTGEPDNAPMELEPPAAAPVPSPPQSAKLLETSGAEQQVRQTSEPSTPAAPVRPAASPPPANMADQAPTQAPKGAEGIPAPRVPSSLLDDESRRMVLELETAGYDQETLSNITVMPEKSRQAALRGLMAELREKRKRDSELEEKLKEWAQITGASEKDVSRMRAHKETEAFEIAYSNAKVLEQERKKHQDLAAKLQELESKSGQQDEKVKDAVEKTKKELEKELDKARAEVKNATDLLAAIHARALKTGDTQLAQIAQLNGAAVATPQAAAPEAAPAAPAMDAPGPAPKRTAEAGIAQSVINKLVAQLPAAMQRIEQHDHSPDALVDYVASRCAREDGVDVRKYIDKGVRFGNEGDVFKLPADLAPWARVLSTIERDRDQIHRDVQPFHMSNRPYITEAMNDLLQAKYDAVKNGLPPPTYSQYNAMRNMMYS